MIPVRVGMLFKVSASLGTSLLIDRERDASNILQENASVVAHYAGVDLEPDPNVAVEHELVRRLRETERARLRRRGVDPTQASAEIRLTVVDHAAAGPVLDPDLVRGSFGVEIERVKRLEDQPGYEDVELLSVDELAVPPSADAPEWAWAVFRYRAIYSSDEVDPHDRILHLASTSVGNVLTHVLYNYSYMLPARPAFSALSLFLFEWRYSVLRAIEGRPPLPVEGDFGDPHWARVERELRAVEPPAPREFRDESEADGNRDKFELLGFGSDPDPEYSPPETDALALVEALYPDLRNSQRHTTLHEMAHGLEASVARDMKLDLDW